VRFDERIEIFLLFARERHATRPVASNLVSDRVPWSAGRRGGNFLSNAGNFLEGDMRKALLGYGEPAPWFQGQTHLNPKYTLDTVGGHPVVLSFYRSAADPLSHAIVEQFESRGSDFEDGAKSMFFGVTTDPQDLSLQRVRERSGMRHYFDLDTAISKLYGAVDQDYVPGHSAVPTADYSCFTVVLDQRLRCCRVVLFSSDPAQHVTEVMKVANDLVDTSPFVVGRSQAPVLIVPRIFEPELCQRLIDHYEQHGGKESGFMRDVNGQTVGLYDYSHKRRRDQEILDENLRRACMIRIHDRLAPEIFKAYQFKATRMERYIVACYEAETQGHFNRHRDNTTIGTAHRKFAVSLNLNTGDFEGGQLWFPEFGRQVFVPPAGGCAVFSCSLLHEALPVTKGKRFVFLPFLYDDAAAQMRAQNERHLGGLGNSPEDAARGERAPT